MAIDGQQHELYVFPYWSGRLMTSNELLSRFPDLMVHAAELIKTDVEVMMGGNGRTSSPRMPVMRREFSRALATPALENSAAFALESVIVALQQTMLFVAYVDA